jgi:hypothetical protein
LQGKRKRKKRYDGWKLDLVFDIAELIGAILWFPFKLFFKLLAHIFD